MIFSAVLTTLRIDFLSEALQLPKCTRVAVVLYAFYGASVESGEDGRRKT